MMRAWSGVFPAVTTQFRKDQSLDLEGTARHIEALIDSGVSGLILLGSLGENMSLENEEKLRVLEMGIKVANGRLPVLSGVAECSTAAACHYARDCERLGADGLMVMPAMIYPADSREALAHFRAVARCIGLPWMLYNNPISYHVDVTPQMLAGLGEIRFIGSRVHGALGEGAHSGSEIRAVAKRIQMDAEHRAGPKRGRGDSLPLELRSPRHLDAPLDVLPVRALRERLVVRREKHEVELGVVGLRDELSDDSGQCHDLALVVHRE